MAKKSKFINGNCQQLLFSPKGRIEGALVKEKGAVVQVTAHPDIGVLFAYATGHGKRLRVLAVANHSPKMVEGVHPVYQFESFADVVGNAIKLPHADSDNATIKGVVVALHFARHGQPNSVILKTGEFIHLRPQGMSQTKLEVGSKVNAVGEVRMTLLNTRLLEAHEVNGIDLH